MSPACIWTVHMSKGVHVWLLHGNILCTHWNSPHLYKQWFEKQTTHTHTSGFNKQFWPRQQFAKLVKDKTNHGPSFTFSKKILLSGIYRKLIANSLRFSVRQQSSLLQITFVARGMSNISVFSIWNLSKCMSLEMATGGGGVAECDHTVVGRILHFFITFGLISLNCFFFPSLEWIVNFSFQAP